MQVKRLPSDFRDKRVYHIPCSFSNKKRKAKDGCRLSLGCSRELYFYVPQGSSLMIVSERQASVVLDTSMRVKAG